MARELKMGKLELSQHEMKELVRFYKEEALPQFIQHDECDGWYGLQISGNMFDLNIYRDFQDKIAATVYPCYQAGEYWETDFSIRHQLDIEEESK
jgi:hypothetical protein